MHNFDAQSAQFSGPLTKVPLTLPIPFLHLFPLSILFPLKKTVGEAIA